MRLTEFKKKAGPAVNGTEACVCIRTDDKPSIEKNRSDTTVIRVYTLTDDKPSLVKTCRDRVGSTRLCTDER
ncbi:MAG: hypothetical protein LBC13_03495 [Clostridiales bacterium]|jgi:hypothetical protein|nr:hypothetical protein [Clostridiales bacterium]